MANAQEINICHYFILWNICSSWLLFEQKVFLAEIRFCYLKLFNQHPLFSVISLAVSIFFEHCIVEKSTEESKIFY